MEGGRKTKLYESQQDTSNKKEYSLGHSKSFHCPNTGMKEYRIARGRKGKKEVPGVSFLKFVLSIQHMYLVSGDKKVGALWNVLLLTICMQIVETLLKPPTYIFNPKKTKKSDSNWIFLLLKVTTVEQSNCGHVFWVCMTSFKVISLSFTHKCCL